MRHIPIDPANEQQTLGCMLLDSEGAVIGDVLAMLGAEHFYDPHHRLIFDAVKSLYQAGVTFDLPLVRDELKRMGALERIGGAAYLLELCDATPSTVNVLHYAGQVKEAYRRRELIRHLQQAAGLAYDPGAPLAGIECHLEKTLSVLSDEPAGLTVPTLLAEILETVDHPGKAMAMTPTGYEVIDEMFSGGFREGELIVLAARPGMGKSALALGMAEHVAVERSLPVLCVSLEMSGRNLMERMVLGRAGVPLWQIRAGYQVSQAKKQDVETAAAAIAQAPLELLDNTQGSLDSVRTAAKRMQRQRGLNLVIIDYLQLLTGGGHSIYERVSMLSRELKCLARELAVPILLLSQLNRAVESRDNKTPRLSDLRDSGSIEQDADAVILLHRDDYYGQERHGYTPNGQATVTIAKHRNGPTGATRIPFDDKLIRFHNPTTITTEAL